MSIEIGNKNSLLFGPRVLGSVATPKGLLNKQGYIVYDSNAISCSVTAQTGGLGGSSGLYLIIDKDKREF